MGTAEPFQVREQRTGRVHRLTPLGEIDLATVPEFRAAFEAAFSDGDTEMIVVDLTKLDFMDSSGLHALMEMSAVCEHADRLRIVNGSPFVVRLFDVSGVRGHLPIITSADDPLAPLPTRPRDPGQL